MKRWWRKTLVNQQKYCIGEKNFDESPTWQIKQKFSLPDASGGLGVKLWRIEVRHAEYQNNLQNTTVNSSSPA